MAQRPEIPFFVPHGDAQMADEDPNQTRSQQDQPPQSYYTTWPGDGFRFYPLPLVTTRALPIAREDWPIQQASGGSASYMVYPNSTSFVPYYFPATSGELRYLPPPNPTASIQPHVFHPPLQIGRHLTTGLPSTFRFGDQTPTVEPRALSTADSEPEPSLPPLSTVLPDHLYLDRQSRQHILPQEPRPQPFSQEPRPQTFSAELRPQTLPQEAQPQRNPVPVRASRPPSPIPFFRFPARDSPDPVEQGLRQVLQEPASALRSASNDMADSGAPLPQSAASLESNVTAPAPVFGGAPPNTPRRHRRRMSRPTMPRVACTACMEVFKLDDLLNLACSCRYCTPCLNAAFQAGCTSKAAFPPKCCGRPLRISVWGSMLDADILQRYKQIEAEFSTSRPLYCAIPTCSTFIPEDQQHALDECGVCSICDQITCKKCRQDMGDHPHWPVARRICPAENAEVAALFALGTAKKWRQCPTCLNMVERLEGCNHMDCICGVEFCYRCGNLFDEDDNCACHPSSWEDDDDDDEEEEGVDESGEEAPAENEEEADENQLVNI
ncbi:hypothetical protein A1O1_00770 [Capronia coronata CBS 617.96]|uniref:RBR-type E3 ubiquitin transferase n=1 Tax=Capronia coronata CBS 617.96 TaxID=1182541 RepID=W9YSX2_9EURO|nr:uncharacterized protein A1O1_00770 [Capronia coronata CBS 617.96]EXJ95648.1 hypothetical protein A1O1_00770 [Capronia coronata CBS 617.96]